MLVPVFALVSLMSCGAFEERSFFEAPAVPGQTSCQSYCVMVLQNCKESAAQYMSWQSCNDACAKFIVTGASHVGDGNSLECRMTYAMAALREPKLAFCNNAGPSGGVSCR